MAGVAVANTNGKTERKPPPVPKKQEPQKVNRHSHLRWIPISETKVCPTGQRELRPAFVDKIAREFDPDNIGFPVVNLRDGTYWIIDGQHRIAALKAIGWEDQQVQCECFEGLTEAEEAEEFLRRQQRIAVKPLDEFRVAISAGREIECDIDRVVRLQGLRVTGSSSAEGSISAVAALRTVYSRGGPMALGKTLRIIRDAFGTVGLTSFVIHGVGLVCIRYQDQIDEQLAVQKLSKVHAGVNGLLNKAAVIREKTGRPKAHCVAAAVVELLNSGRGRAKLADWWRETSEEKR